MEKEETAQAAELRTEGQGPFDDHAPDASAERRDSPWRLFWLTIAAVFIAETFVMIMLARHPSVPAGAAALLDGLLVTALLVPVLYLWLVRPLKTRVAELGLVRQKLNRSREAYRSLIDSTEDSIYLVDAGGRYQFVNQHHAARLGLPARAIYGKSYADFHDPAKAAEFATIIAAVVRERRSHRQEYVSQRDERFFLRTFSPVTGPAGEVVAVTVVSKDITDLKRFEQRLQELSTTDELTGLANRRGFETLASHRLKVTQRQGNGAALLYADLDNLKQINDRLGHAAGDRAIRDAGRLLAESCRESDIVARIGGDEFVVLLTGSATQGIDLVIARIEDAVARYNAGGTPDQALGVSIGYASCPAGEPCTVFSLLSLADRAMYEAKARRKSGGGSGVVVPAPG